MWKSCPVGSEKSPMPKTVPPGLSSEDARLSTVFAWLLPETVGTKCLLRPGRGSGGEGTAAEKMHHLVGGPTDPSRTVPARDGHSGSFPGSHSSRLRYRCRNRGQRRY